MRLRIAKIMLVCVLFALLLALALLVGNGSYEATAIGWIPLVMYCTAIILAWVYSRVLKHGLKLLERTDLHDVDRDEQVRYTVRFRNTVPLFYFQIEAYFYIADMWGNITNRTKTTLALPPLAKYDMDLNVRFAHIGNYRAGLESVVV
jgi:hypothetical protein